MGSMAVYPFDEYCRCEEPSVYLCQQENNIVTFVSFNDSTEIAEEDTLQKSSVLGMDILVNINIAPTVKMGVHLFSEAECTVYGTGLSVGYVSSVSGHGNFTGNI